MTRFTLLLLGLLGVFACRPANGGNGADAASSGNANDGEASGGRGVLVIAMDAIRASHLTPYGYDLKTTPFLEELSRDGLVVDRAYSSAPVMREGHVALLTGCDPTVAIPPPLPGMENQPPDTTRLFLPERIPRIARTFLVEGFRTAAFSDHPWFSPVIGFQSGFEKFSSFRDESASTVRTAHGFPGVSGRFKDWVKGLDREEDWFAYLQVSDLERIWSGNDPKWDDFFQPRAELSDVPPVSTHSRAFFAVPKRRWSGGASTIGDYVAKYDGNLREMDQHLARLCDWLRRQNRFENTTIVFVGSYGLGFGESGLIVDSGTLHDVDLHVPLVFRPAPALGIEVNRRIDALFSLVDVGPTLLELYSLPVPRGMHGISLVDTLRGHPEAHQRRIAYASGGVHDGFCVWTGDRKLCDFLPAGRGSLSLLASWTGREKRSGVKRVRELRDLEKGIELPLSDPMHAEEAASLARAAAIHYDWLSKARDVLHPKSWESESPDPALLRELEDLGWIAPELR